MDVWWTEAALTLGACEMGVEWPTLQEPLGTGLHRASVLHIHEVSPTLRTGSNEMVVELRLTYLVLARCFLNANFTVVFVHSGCCNKIPYTWWFISLRNLFLVLQNLGCPRSRPWLLWCQVMALILVHRQDYSLCLLTAERRQGSSLGAVFVRALIRFPSIPPPPSLPSWYHHPGVWAQQVNVGWGPKPWTIALIIWMIQVVLNWVNEFLK